MIKNRVRVASAMFGGSGWYEISHGDQQEHEDLHRDGKRLFAWQNRPKGPIVRSWYMQWPSGHRGKDASWVVGGPEVMFVEQPKGQLVLF